MSRTYRPRTTSSLTGSSYGTIDVGAPTPDSLPLTPANRVYACACRTCGYAFTKSATCIKAYLDAPPVTGCVFCSARKRVRDAQSPESADAVAARDARIRVVWASGNGPITYEELSAVFKVPAAEIAALVPAERLGCGQMNYRELGKIFGLSHEFVRQVVKGGGCEPGHEGRE